MGRKTANMDGNNVIRKIGLLLGVAACGALVTSCGGDDDDPTPTPTGSSTPTPSPTSSELSLTADFTASSGNANYIYAFFTPDTGGTEVFNGGSRINGNGVIEFVASPDSASFIFPDLSEAAVFGAAEFVSVSATQRFYQMGTAALTMFLPDEEVMRVTYDLDDQPFTRNSVEGTLRSRRSAIFFSPVTTTTDIASTLTYSGDIDVAGGDPGVTAADTVSAPQTTFTVTPGTDDTISGTIAIFETVASTQTQIASFEISAKVGAGGTFDGAISDTTYALTGNYVGALAGDDREEVFIIFSAIDSDPDDDDDRVFVGSYIGN